MTIHALGSIVAAARIPLGKNHQRGAILLFCLVFLALLTMTATVSMEAAIVEQRAAARMQDHQLALQAAAAALDVAEEWLGAQTLRPQSSTDGSTRVWQHDALDPDVMDSLPWWQDAARQRSWWDNAPLAVVMEGLSAPPRYVIEELAVSAENVSAQPGAEVAQPSWQRVVYRISARGSGRMASSSVVLQSIQVGYYRQLTGASHP